MNNNTYKTKLCRFFQENGDCKFGDNCRYAHNSNELNAQGGNPNNFRNYNDRPYNNRRFNNYNDRPYNNRRFNDRGNFNNNNNGHRDNDLSKTKLCKFFQNGDCRYNDNCRYAHGESELRQ